MVSPEPPEPEGPTDDIKVCRVNRLRGQSLRRPSPDFFVGCVARGETAGETCPGTAICCNPLQLEPLQPASRAEPAAGRRLSRETVTIVSGLAQFENQFLESWRNDLLDRAWNALSELERSSRQPYYTVLRSRVEHPDLKSNELAKRLSAALGRPLTAGAVRQALQRSRQKYVDYLVEEVLGSLDHPTRDELEEELSDLKLLDQCRPYLKRRLDHA